MGCGGKLIAEEEKENPKSRHGLRYRAIRGTSEGLWRNKPHSPCNIRKESKKVNSTAVVTHQETDGTPLVIVASDNHSTNSGDENKNRTEERVKKKRKFEGVVEAALFDACLLVKRSFLRVPPE